MSKLITKFVPIGMRGGVTGQVLRHLFLKFFYFEHQKENCIEGVFGGTEDDKIVRFDSKPVDLA